MSVRVTGADLTAFGRRLKRRRHELELTLLQLAHRSGLSKTYLCDLEHGRQEPGMRSLDRLARALGLTLNYVVRGRRT